MRLENLKVKNLFGLKENEFDFSADKPIVIVGKNGSGKSSIMDAAYVALFGHPTTARGVDQKDYVRKGTYKATVSLEFLDAKGTRRKVSRSFQYKGPTLKSDAMFETYTPDGWVQNASGVTDTNEMVANCILNGELSNRENHENKTTLQMAERIVENSCFISQGSINALLDLSPAKRFEIISAALGLEQADLLKDASKDLKSISSQASSTILTEIETMKEALREFKLPEELEADIKEKKQVLKGTESRLERVREYKKLSKEKSDLDSRLVGLNIEYQKKKSGYLYADAKKRYDNFSSAVSIVAENQKQITSVKKKKQDMEAEIPGLKEQIGKLAEQIKETQEHLLKSNRYNSVIPIVSGFDKASDEIKDLTVKIEDAEKREKTVSMLGSVFASYQKSDSIRALQEKIKKLTVTAVQTLTEQIRQDILIFNTNAAMGKLRVAYDKSEKYSDAAEKLKDVSGHIAKLTTAMTTKFIDLLRILASDGKIDIEKLDAETIEKFGTMLSKSDFMKLTDAIAAMKTHAAEYRKAVETFQPSPEEIALIQNNPKPSEDVETYKNKAVILKTKIEDEKETLSKYKKGNIPGLEEMKTNLKNLGELTDEEKKLLQQPRPEDKDYNAETVRLNTQIRLYKENITSKQAELESLKEKISAVSSEETAAVRSGEAQKEAEKSLSLSYELKNLTKSHNLLSEKCTKSQNILTQAESYLAANMPVFDVNIRKMRTFTEEWLQVRDREKDRAAYTEKIKNLKNVSSCTSEEVERVKGQLEEIESRKKKIEKSLSLFGTNINPEEEKTLEQTRTELIGAIKHQECKLEERKVMADKIAAKEESASEIIKKADIFSGFVKAASSPEFTRFVSDEVMRNLLDGVNSDLRDNNVPWQVFSKNNTLFVQEDGKERKLSGLSGGEATLVSVLLFKRLGNLNCLWIDEGLSMLDEERLRGILDILNNNGNTQIITVTHDMDLAAEFPIVWEMSEGEKVKDREALMEELEI